MDIKKKLQLQRHQQAIINDLEVNYIMDELFTKNAISSEDFDQICKLQNGTDQTRLLLEKLVRNGTNDTYEAFVDSLAKDYNWLWEKLTMENNNQINNDSFEDSLSKGDVPRLPEHHVRRLAMEQDLAAVLTQLTRYKIVAVHGMSGSGKTCVVLSALRNNPDLITNNFNCVVFWLNFGNCKTDDDIIQLQSRLLRKASATYMLSSYNMNSSISMSSIGSNGDSQTSSTLDWTSGDLKDRLKTQFCEPPLKDCLLVLDEVNDRKCLEAFDIGCKILVTTRDTDVVATYSPQIIEVKNGLEEKESLEVFASFLDVKVSSLPRQAHKLHEICKGIPFNIRLIGAQLAENKEKLMDDPKYWNYFVKKFEKKEFFLTDFFLSKQSKQHADDPMKTIEVCINSLNDNLRPLYKRLKILPDNVKVSASVLSKLWNKDVPEVQTIMKHLRNKSLIIEVYDREQKNYLYEVHDLIMNYLRSKGPDSKKIHAELLKSYNYDSGTAPVEIVDDGYIAYYIGYHIKHAEDSLWSLFGQLFLNLIFLGNKVKLTGSADVIADLKKYEGYISTDKLYLDLLRGIKSFLSTHGADLYHYPCTNIIQSILQHESKGILYTKACQYAQDNCHKNELYFEFLHEENVEEIKHSTIDVKEKVQAVCFLGDFVLVGCNSGVVKFFHIPTNKLRKELRGPGSPVTWVGVSCSTEPQIVVALFTDGSIQLWYVDDLQYDDTNEAPIIEEESEDLYNKYYAETETISPKVEAYLNCRWSNNEQFLISHTKKMIVLHNPLPREKNKIIAAIDNFERDCEIKCCVPYNQDRYVIVGKICKNINSVEVIDLETKERVITFEETDIVLDIVTVPGSNKIITLKANEVMEYEIKFNPNSLKHKKVIASEDVKENIAFLSIAVNKSGSLLFVSTDDSRVVCVDLKTYTTSFDLENRRGNVVSMAVSELTYDEFEPGSDVLLTGTGTIEDNAKVWYLDASYICQTAQRNGRVRLTTNFDVSFLSPTSPQTPSSLTTNSGVESATNTPRRHQSFTNHKEVTKNVLKNTLSLDRHSLKPLNLKGICNNNYGVSQPLLAVIDDKSNIQVMRGQKVLTEITEKSNEHITRVKISPCNQYIIYGLKSGIVKKFTLRTKKTVVIMDVYSKVQYLDFVHRNLLIVSGQNGSLMAYQFCLESGVWKTKMMQRGDCNLGSQELLNDIQGIKRKTIEKVSSSSSETSLNSKERFFQNGEKKSLLKRRGLVDCYLISGLGIITVECNATTKLWDENLNMITILIGRQVNTVITATAFQNNILVICDEQNKGFQAYELRQGGGLRLQSIQEYKLNNVIVSCALTADGNILAMGLNSGNIVVWNVRRQHQITLLKHHTTKVHSCSFSPVPERSNRNSLTHGSPHIVHSPYTTTVNCSITQEDCNDQPPLVLVTMAAEIVWWNLTYIMKARATKITKKPAGVNLLSPVASPMEIKPRTPTVSSNATEPTNCNFFFGDTFNEPEYCWKANWKGKCCKQGSKRKDILSCIKLSGMNAKRLCHDNKFSCFVTVDNPGHIHIMNVLKQNNT